MSNVDGYRQASETEVAVRSDLASSVACILEDAGIPVTIDQACAGSGGAVVDVDRGDDAAGGVYVSWRPGASLIERANRLLLNEKHDHGDIRFMGQVSESMMLAMLEILRHCGVDATVADDDLRPYSIRVLKYAPGASRQV
jgi:hypothetical protein